MSASPPYRPAWWLPGGHAQTLFAALARRPRADLPLVRHQCELPDGDFLDLRSPSPPTLPAGRPAPAGDAAIARTDDDDDDRAAAGDRRPIVLLLHGLEGSYRSPYIQGMIAALQRRNLRPLLLHFRGCGGQLNRLPVSYHSGYTGDLAYIIEQLREREPTTPLAAVGYSLGGNVLLKYLADRGGDGALQAAVAVSVPYDLGCAADRVARGFSRLYQYRLLRSLRRTVARKLAEHPDALDLSPEQLRKLTTFRLFDDRVTAPLHGFAGVEDYYTRCSTRDRLREIATPTLLIHARDDPFMTPAAIPDRATLPQNVTLELHDRGGHVGFVAGTNPLAPVYHLEHRIPAYLAAHLPGPRTADPQRGKMPTPGATAGDC